MLVSYTEECYARLEQELDQVDAALIPDLKKLSASLHLIAETMDQLKSHITEHPFESDEQEITFFKYIKPKFYSWYIYCTEHYNIFNAVPKGPDLLIRDYYLQELSFIQRHFNQNQFLYQYYLQDEKAKDELYFLRGNHHQRMYEVLTGSTDAFRTAQDYNFSKFRAYEMLQDELIRRLRLLYQHGDTSIIPPAIQPKKPRWTGEKINLVELAYGIYYSGEMNDGKAEIGDVVSWLEDSLEVDLGRAYRKFIDIRRRKTISYTHFLDRMREHIHHKISESDRYTPKPFRRTPLEKNNESRQ